MQTPGRLTRPGVLLSAKQHRQNAAGFGACPRAGAWEFGVSFSLKPGGRVFCHGKKAVSGPVKPAKSAKCAAIMIVFRQNRDVV
jgi:hypothetical protein